MDTRSSTDLKKILETMEADKRELAQQMKAMQEQIHELAISQTHGYTRGKLFHCYSKIWQVLEGDLGRLILVLVVWLYREFGLVYLLN
ncbi:hypothetical protein QVD17_37496 [Tagetes erecta]|uniref:Uncharacterized protein n=1 Tax=Tagetes erecta TaxID=13708 RepID=A0AAD8JW48_TARER|nr:hypothetical protein QVD17_37496 [Tagetes erecta]